MAAQAKITEEAQTFIVEALARYKSPTQVVRMVKDEFGIDLKRQNVRHYNPYQSKEAENWKDLFDKTRENFTRETKSIGAAHQSYRLQELMVQYWKADAQGNAVIAANILKQMAEEVGGLYTNKRNLTINPRDALAKFLGCPVDDLPDTDNHA